MLGGRISRVFLELCKKLGVPLVLLQGPQRPAHVSYKKSGHFSSCEAGTLGLALESLLVK